MSEENKTLMRRWFEEVWNRGRAEAIDELFAEDGVAHGLEGTAGGELRGPSDFRAFHQRFRESFPDIEVEVVDTISEGDKVAALCTVRGRHQGDALGFGPTGQTVEFAGMTFVRVRDGQIVEAWNNFDFMSMYQQLGALRLQTPGTEGIIGDM